VIGEALFEIAFVSKRGARAVPEAIEEFIQHSLLRHTDEIFSHCDPDGAIARIDVLEVDLGDINGPDFQVEMEERFKDRLRKALRKKMRVLSTAPAEGEGIVTLEMGGFEQLCHFLEMGYVRDSAALLDAGAPEQLLEHAVHHQSGALAGFLKRTARREDVLRRLAMQFPEALLDELLEMLAPGASASLRARMPELEARLARRSRTTTSAGVRRYVYEILFGLLTHRTMAGGDVDSLLGEFVSGMDAGGEMEARDASLGQDDIAGALPSAERLRESFEHALETGDVSGLEGGWGGLIERHADMVREVVASRVQDVSRRDRIISVLPESMLRQLLPLLDPADAILMEDVLRGPGPESGVSETTRVEVLLSGFAARLSGARDGAFTDGIEVLIAHHADALAGFLLGGIDTSAPGRLHAGEAQALVRFLIGRKARGDSGVFLESVETLAGEAKDIASYYRHVLQQLLAGARVDLVEAAGMAAEQAAPTENELLRMRLEQALVTGDVSDIGGDWAGMLRRHAGLVREVFARRMGDALLRDRLASSMSAPMLRELVAVLRPELVDMIDSLLALEELSGDEASAMFWRHSLTWMHDARMRATGEGTGDYLRSLLEAGLKPATLRRAVQPITPELAEIFRTHDTPEALLGRLKGRLLGNVADDVSREIAQLVRHHARMLAGYLEGVADLSGLARLQAGEAHELTRFLIDWKGKGASRSFLDTVERQAAGVKDAASYYRFVLRHLLADAVVDLAEAVRAGAGQASPITEERFRTLMEKALNPSDAVLLDESLRGTEPVTGASDATPAEALLEWFGARLSGTTYEEVTDAIKALGADHADALADYLTLGLDAASIARLRAGEARALARFLIVRRGGEGASVFLESVEKQAQEARNREAYAHSVLRQLLAGKTVDLAEAGLAEREAPDAADEDAIRARIEQALVTGDVSGLEDDWAGMLRHHADFVRGVFARRMGDVLLRDMLASGMSAPMLRELVKVLHPDSGDMIGLLLAQPELQDAGRSGLLWSFTFAWLHEAGDPPAGPAAYIRGLMNMLADAGMDRRAFLSAVQHVAPEVVAGLRDVAETGDLTGRAPAGLAVHPLARLAARLSGSVSGDIADEIDSLAAHHADVLAAYLARGIEAKALAGLHTGEVRALIRFLVGHKGKGSAGAFLESMERYAAEAGDQGAYYRYVLGRLLADEAVELSWEGVRAGDRETPQGGSGPDEVETVTVQALLNRLQARLAGASVGEVSREIGELARMDADSLAHMLEQGHGVMSGLDRLGLAEARGLAFFLIRRKAGQRAGSFLEAIESQAEHAMSIAAYYRQILRHLLRDEPVDLLEAARFDPVRQRDEVGRERLRDEKDRDDKQGRDKPSAIGEILVGNAGQVLLGAYLPRLFKVLELTQNGRFRDHDAAQRAVHLIQFAVNASSDMPEFLLPLNKILCGLPVELPIIREVRLQEKEQETIEGMLTAMIQNWSIIGRTSIEGLRESFLQRGGRLVFRDDAWHLTVEKRGIDVLLDQLPWNYTLIRHPWMASAVHVEWR